MRSSASRTPIPALAGRSVMSAYVFGDGIETHGAVLTLDDNTDISIEFNCASRLVTQVLATKADDDDGVLLQNID